jgi:hypothetical protein
VRLVRLPLAVALVACSLALALPASAGEAGTPYVTVARYIQGPYHELPLDVSVPRGESKAFYIKVVNTTPREIDQDVTLTDVTSGDVKAYRVKWLKGLAGGKDISSDMKRDGYDFVLEPGIARGFKVRIRHRSVHADQLCLRGLFHPEPHGDGDGADFRVNGLGLCVLPAPLIPG